MDSKDVRIGVKPTIAELTDNDIHIYIPTGTSLRDAVEISARQIEHQGKANAQIDIWKVAHVLRQILAYAPTD